MGEENLTIRAEAKGTEETAKKLDAVAAADKRLQTQVGEVTATTDKATEAQKKRTASTEDWTGILSRVHPALGGLADAMVKGSRIAGDLATQNINLGGALKSVTSAVKNNAAALALIGAGGAAVAAIYAIVAAVRKMKEEFDAVTAAIKRQQNALNELKSEEQDRQQAIEDVSDTRRRGGFEDAETSRRVGQMDTDLRRQFPNLKVAAITQTLGMMGDMDLSRQELAEAAFMEGTIDGGLGLDRRMAPSQMRARFEGQAGRYRTNLDTFFGREEEQGQTGVRPGGARTEAARREVMAVGGSTTNIQAVIRQLYPTIPDEDMAELLDTIARYPSTGAVSERRAAMVTPTRWNPPAPAEDSVLGSRLLRVLEAIERNPHGTVNNNCKFVGPSADSQRRARRNGESAAAAAERFR